MKFFFISFLFFTLDTVSKYIVNLKLMVGEIVEILLFLI